MVHSKLRSLKNRFMGPAEKVTEAPSATSAVTVKASHFPLEYQPQIHEQNIRDFFSQEGRQLFSEPHRPLDAKKILIVCFINRSGSNWLCETLHATGLTAHGDEFFNEARLKKTCEKHGIKSLDEYIREMFKPKLQVNGSVTMKLSWDQLYFLTKERVIPEILQHAEFIYPIRRDMAAQALSLEIAEQTGQWRSDWNSGINKAPAPDAITDEAILSSIQRIAHHHSQFLQYFGTFGIHPHMMFYEDLLADTHAEMDRLLVKLGMAESGKWSLNQSKQVMKKQSTSKSAERLEKFRRNMYERCE
jgi:LPS sulfotransferase NodH